MRYFVLGLTLLLALTSGAPAFAQTKGEGWKVYYIDESGDRYYYDKGSVETPQKGSVIVWQKITGISNYAEVDKSVARIQLNCRQETYRVLPDAKDEGSEEKKAQSTRNEVQADSKFRALFENVCPF